jgi:hypothetical protein
MSWFPSQFERLHEAPKRNKADFGGRQQIIFQATGELAGPPPAALPKRRSAVAAHIVIFEVVPAGAEIQRDFKALIMDVQAAMMPAEKRRRGVRRLTPPSGDTTYPVPSRSPLGSKI